MGAMLASGAAWRAPAMFAVSLVLAGLSVPAEAGDGTSQCWSNAPGDTNDSGFAWQLALGHDAWPGRVSQTPGIHAAPFLAIGAGDGDRVSHEAFAVGVRLDWRL